MKNKMNVDQYIQENKKKVNPKYLPQYHLHPPTGWMNDPNGFVYYRGEYHLFYQHYPYESIWGPMHWGHAKTKDFIHWEDLPVALEPTEDYEKDGCFSGSAIEKDGKLYLMYTGHYNRNGRRREVQCIASSSDGIHFEKHPNNPVISELELGDHGMIEEFRDPKVFEHDGAYYAVVASKTKDNRGLILMFKSEDLINWSFFSKVLEGSINQGIMWECPDLFPLDGKWVMIFSPIQHPKLDYEFHNLSSTIAFIGDMDWETGKFEVENSHEIDLGLDFYAPQTCYDGENRIMIAWMQMWERNIPSHDLNHGWAGQMSLARKLSIQDNRLCQKAILPALSGKRHLKLEPSSSFHLRYGHEEEYIDMRYHEGFFVFDRSHMQYKIEGSEKQPYQGRKIPLNPKKEHNFVFLVDRSSLEIFIDDCLSISLTHYFEKNDELNFYLVDKTGNLVFK